GFHPPYEIKGASRRGRTRSTARHAAGAIDALSHHQFGFTSSRSDCSIFTPFAVLIRPGVGKDSITGGADGLSVDFAFLSIAPLNRFRTASGSSEPAP